MKLVMERRVLFLSEITDKDRERMKENGYIYLDDDIFGNEIWEQEIYY